MIIRKTYPELQSNHIKKFFEEYPYLRRFYSKSDKTIYYKNGSTLSFRFLQHTDDVYVYQGQEFEDWGLDECTQHSEEVFRVLTSSMRTTHKDIKPKFLLTGNPGGPGHGWVKRLFIDRAFLPEDGDAAKYDFVQAYVFDNIKLLQTDPNYVKRLEALPEDKRRAYLEGDWNVFEGQFFSEWRTERHVIKPRYSLAEAPSNYVYRLCWDEGMRAPRAVYLLVQDNDGRVEVVWEYYKKGETAVSAARKVRQALLDMKVYSNVKDNGAFVYDPSMETSSTQTGLSTAKLVNEVMGLPVMKANNDRVVGASRFKEYLHWDNLNEPLLRVWDTCPNFIRTIPALVYRDNGAEDVDTDMEDHAYDAVRYGLMSLTKMPTRFKGENIVKRFRYALPRSIWDRR